MWIGATVWVFKYSGFLVWTSQNEKFNFTVDALQGFSESVSELSVSIVSEILIHRFLVKTLQGPKSLYLKNLVLSERVPKKKIKVGVWHLKKGVCLLDAIRFRKISFWIEFFFWLRLLGKILGNNFDSFGPQIT